MARICPACRAIPSEADRYCRACGRPLSDDAPKDLDAEASGARSPDLSAESPSPHRSGPGRAVLLLAIVAVLSAATGVLVGLGVWPADTTESAQPARVSSTAAASKSANAEQSELSQVAALVKLSARARNEVVGAVQAAGSCDMKPARGVGILEKAIAERKSAIGQIGKLSTAGIPGGQPMIDDLETSLRQSSKADEGFIGWMKDMASSGSCPVDPATDTSYQNGYRASKAASTAKAQFLKLWNPLARQFDQPVFTVNKI